MNGFLTTFQWITDPISAVLGVGISSAFEWFGSCLNGACQHPTDVALENIFNAFGTILQWLQNIATVAWIGILNILPSGGNFGPEMHTAAIYFGNSLQSVSFMLPVDAMVYCLILSLNVLFALWSFHVVRTILNFARGIGTDRMSVSDGVDYGGASRHKVFGDSRFS